MRGIYLFAPLCLILGLATPPLYDSYIESRFNNICHNSHKITVIDKQKLHDFIDFVTYANSHRTEEMWHDELRKAGFQVRDDTNFMSFGTGITEYPIHVIAQGRDIATVKNVVLYKPNWGAILLINKVPLDGDCAYGSTGYYPKFWRLLNR